MSLHYVILRHEGIETPHFDLLFETSPTEKLAAWRSDAWPISSLVELTKLPDHRREYLEYEGPISGGRGSVKRVEAGQYELQRVSEPRWVVELPSGKLTLTRIEGDRWRASG